MLRYVTALTVYAPALAQSFNIDLGIGLGVPTSSYGAASGQTGHWNGIPNPHPNSIVLKDLSGVQTSVTLETTGGQDLQLNIPPNGTKTSGNDQRLMDDIWDPGGGLPGGGEITLRNISPGDYIVHVYASAPDDVGFRSGVRVNGSSITFIGGSWPSPFAFAAPTTHAVYAVQVGADRLLTIDVEEWVGYASVNGFQITFDDSTCTGDLDGDGATDQSDLGIVLAAYLTCPGDPFYSEPAGLLVPEDPCVTQADLGVLLAHYGCQP